MDLQRPGFIRLNPSCPISHQVFDFDYYLKEVPEFEACGEPDIWAEFEFSHAPYFDDHQSLGVQLHRQVLVEASPFVSAWVDEGPFVLEYIKCEQEEDSAGFVKFLVFLYTKILSPNDLFQVFGFASKFEVPIPEEAFKRALSSSNMLRLLDKFPMTKEVEQNYRKWILENVEMRSTEVINSSYFCHMKSSTLEEVACVLGQNEPDRRVLVKTITKWGFTECDRQGLGRSRENIQYIFPYVVQDMIGWHRPRVNLQGLPEMPYFQDGEQIIVFIGLDTELDPSIPEEASLNLDWNYYIEMASPPEGTTSLNYVYNSELK